jgi:hypothetical protein
MVGSYLITGGIMSSIVITPSSTITGGVHVEVDLPEQGETRIWEVAPGASWIDSLVEYTADLPNEQFAEILHALLVVS